MGRSVEATESLLARGRRELARRVQEFVMGDVEL